MASPTDLRFVEPESLLYLRPPLQGLSDQMSSANDGHTLYVGRRVAGIGPQARRWLAGSVHDDRVAGREGFRSALVLGISLYGYACDALTCLWGKEYPAGWALGLRFRRPVYDGTALEIRIGRRACDDTRLTITMTSPEGEAVVTGDIHVPLSLGSAYNQPFAMRNSSAIGAPADPMMLWEGMTLSPLTVVMTPTLCEEWGGMLDLPMQRDRLSPALLQMLASHCINKSIARPFPPVMRSSHGEHLGCAVVGDKLVASGAVTGVSEREGRRYYEAAVRIVAQAATGHSNVAVVRRSVLIARPRP